MPKGERYHKMNVRKCKKTSKQTYTGGVFRPTCKMSSEESNRGPPNTNHDGMSSPPP